MNYPPILLCLLLSCGATCCTTAQAQTSPTVCLPARQAQLIARSLRRYEALKPVVRQMTGVKDSLLVINAGLHRGVTLQDSAYQQLTRVVGYKDVLGRDADNRAAAWKSKARKRSWTNVALSALLVLVTVLCVR